MLGQTLDIAIPCFMTSIERSSGKPMFHLGKSDNNESIIYYLILDHIPQ